ncbi:glycosyltransferase [Lyngbya aestuarii]|uniref:glycosyltransferase n=1 Tax=Lyngbya aestuarii TaxID=118322 RepID=UPI00403D8984
MKATYKKPRICIALPGIHYLADTTYILNTRPLLPYFAEDFEVTLVVRKNLETPEPGANYLTILDPTKLSSKEADNQDPYFVPTDPFRAIKYLKVLDKFAQKHAQEFDLVIERQWSLVGAFSSAFSRYGVPSIFIAEAEFYTQKCPQERFKKILKFSLNQIIPHLRRRWIRQANSIIVETDQMKSFLTAHGYPISNKPVYSIPNGIDPNIFFPQDRYLCREKLGIEQDTIVFTYVGSLRGFIQEPGPIIEALGREQPKNVVLHMIGDGKYRRELEAIARKFNSSVIFHGRLSQQEAALYIGAANVCVAPYNKQLFPDELFTSASLKVCEYLACGRPVITIPCERMEYLLNGSDYGFFVENQVEDYRRFFRNLPSKEQINQVEKSLITDLSNSILKEKGIVLTWSEIAQMYKKVIRDNLSKKPEKLLYGLQKPALYSNY